MPNEVKQRKKPQQQKPSDDKTETVANGSSDGQKEKAAAGHFPGREKSFMLDFKSMLCLLSLTACGALSWVVLQQNERFSEMEGKFLLLIKTTSPLVAMEQEIQTVSKKCESVRLKLESLGTQKGVESGLKQLEHEIILLRNWASGLSEKQSHLQTSLITLRAAVAQIEKRTSTIAMDFTSKVTSVRTDVRRMDGLRSELESLLSQVGRLEDKATQAERSMVKRIGDVLTSSIDRVSNLRSSSEHNSRAIEQLQRRIPELVSADTKLSEQLRDMESGRAKLIRTVTFASNLKPKVFTIKRDFGALEPQLSDLTLRIGQLAEDVMKREQEILELRHTLGNLTKVDSELGNGTRQVSDTIDGSENV